MRRRRVNNPCTQLKQQFMLTPCLPFTRMTCSCRLISRPAREHIVSTYDVPDPYGGVAPQTDCHTRKLPMPLLWIITGQNALRFPRTNDSRFDTGSGISWRK
jgi:hypothetical protein